MLSMLYVRLTIKVKVGIPESFKVGWYPHKITSSISSLFTAHCYANEVSRHTNPSNFGMMKIKRGLNGGNICY